ncbi:DUF2087 domain-containing protein [Chitinimonas sp. BJYL2]|uniref:DUF2087 domain-containing protein n=1 Tax=Chitinimonas sp. BJYL2 TaxID=2976696 RepID=UPI0022B4DD93|nr:DUF2087 domain-containing protein [Chitinimonas sp. BJYL2]
MSRPVFPFYAPDISALARSLSKQWAEQTEPPSHVQMLNMLARAIGQQNFQQFRTAAPVEPAAPVLPPVAPDYAEQRAAAATASNADTRRLLRHFDEAGRLLRWPGKFSEQLPCIWTIWARLPARRDLSEKAINEYIKRCETFGDHVLLRRELVNYKLVERTPDGSTYRRIEQPPPSELTPLLQAVLGRQA